MRKLTHLVFQKEFRIFFLILSLCCFLWPMLAIPNLSNVKLVFYWLNGSWLMLIVVLFLCDHITKDKTEKITENEK